MLPTVSPSRARLIPGVHPTTVASRAMRSMRSRSLTFVEDGEGGEEGGEGGVDAVARGRRSTHPEEGMAKSDAGGIRETLWNTVRLISLVLRVPMPTRYVRLAEWSIPVAASMQKATCS